MNTEVKEVTRYKWEYGNFLEFVKKKKLSRAMLYAKTMGIDRRTLVHWVSQPELRDALTDAIDELVEGMKHAGKNDWRMWRELYSMLGLDDVKNLDVTSNGETVSNPYDGLTTEELRKLAGR